MYINGNYFSLEINKKRIWSSSQYCSEFFVSFPSSSNFYFMLPSWKSAHFWKKNLTHCANILSSRLKTRVTARELRSEDKDSRKRLLVVPLCECPNIHFVLFSEAEKEDLHDLSPDMSITLRHERILKAIHWRDL